MLWQELTAGRFAQAVKDVGGVCLVSVGCLERHGEHLPLGTDFLNGFAVCRLAAEQEPAIVFPPYYFGQIHEARCFPGAVAIDPVLAFNLLRNVFEEIARNGLHKIVIHNAHGGNRHLLGYLIQAHLDRRRDYSLYLAPHLSAERQKQWDAIMDSDFDHHAGETETSISLANHEQLVHMDRIADAGRPRKRHAAIPPGGTVTHGWYADFPDHYAGDARPATKAKGLKLRQLVVDNLAEYVRAVKADTAVAAVAREFYERCDNVGL